jgi:hypothetical protein
MGSVDNLWAAVAFFGTAIFFIVLIVFWNLISGGVDALWDSDIGPDIKADGNDLINTFDIILLLGYFGIHLGIIATSYFLRSHPIGYILVIFVTVVLVMVAAPLSNAYEDFTNADEFSTASEEIPITNHLISMLPFYEMMWSILNGIVLYGFAKKEALI